MLMKNNKINFIKQIKFMKKVNFHNQNKLKNY